MAFAWTEQKRADWFGRKPLVTPSWVRRYSYDWANSSAKAAGGVGLRAARARERPGADRRLAQGDGTGGPGLISLAQAANSPPAKRHGLARPGETATIDLSPSRKQEATRACTRGGWKHSAMA